MKRADFLRLGVLAPLAGLFGRKPAAPDYPVVVNYTPDPGFWEGRTGSMSYSYRTDGEKLLVSVNGAEWEDCYPVTTTDGDVVFLPTDKGSRRWLVWS